MADNFVVYYEQWGGTDVLKSQWRDRPKPAADEVVVAVTAAGVNPVDYKIQRGYIQAWPSAFPIVPGWDVAGVVVERGSDAKDFVGGESVYGYIRPLFESGEKIADNGGYQSFVAVSEKKLSKKPVGLSHAEAGSIPLAGLTAWQGIFDQGGVTSGSNLLILNGSGGVGSFAIQFAKAKGANVITTCSSRNVDFVKGLGADHVVDYTKGNVADAVLAIVPGGVDVVFDCIGGDDLLEGFKAMKDDGQLVTIVDFNIDETAKKFPGKKAKVFLVAPSRSQLDEISQLIGEGKVRVSAVTSYSLRDAAKAQEESENHHVRGKLVLIP